jgi:hypothetical protein
MAKNLTNNKMNTKPDYNRDPLTGEPGAHPVGTGVGTAGGALAGAAVGAVAGPVGAAVGAVVGGLGGGLAGKGVAESVNPTLEDAHWSANHDREAYYDAAYTYDGDYAPAYRHGYSAYETHKGKSWGEVEDRLASGWEKAKGNSRLGWDKAKHAARAAWNRVEDAIPGDSDGDGH